jgi:hypothetical protein
MMASQLGRAPALPRRRPNPATTVTVYVQTLLTPQVRLIENGLATANSGLLAYCGIPGMPVAACDDLTTHWGSLTSMALRRLLVQQALLLMGAVQGLDGVAPPFGVVGASAWQMARLLEDVALDSTQLATPLQEMAAALPADGALPSARELTTQLRANRVGYSARGRAVVALLRRADGWLESIDQETGAHLTLPGFQPGQLPLEQQLSLP